MNQAIRAILCAAAAISLVACAGFGGASIGGTLGGLASGQSIVLQNNGGDNLTVTANGSFTFATNVSSGDAYNVTILTQPTGQTCTVTSPSGTVDTNSDNVTSVVVSCTTALLSGTITGLRASISQTINVTATQTNAVTPIAVVGGGTGTDSFAFPNAVTNTSYTVSVPQNPQLSGQTCAVTSAATVITPVSNVTIACS